MKIISIYENKGGISGWAGGVSRRFREQARSYRNGATL
ncbi:hypothetical protein C4K05_5897 [Pseudomonas chlororaphis subsp. aureofaciens]|uniref:Uncharacterized protein n=1 Tax=Pseudomonas chlororaphis subsp. aureofaciens TaxID=587851 RepID=A0AAD0ZLK9_9PSED|nr:hypothetical protein C4K08_5926 [Pseudomonas chlororaphis subsp. aureofaciens]AZE32550.1 hypothetical protein C4K07_5810 [Pseudomonas chlororaphis subsp. aureofaciens]AZE45192.1 hypothetical protein C4K05_5897 [Pseudomonas chlororaphis subsp. aureofaciens]